MEEESRVRLQKPLKSSPFQGRNFCVVTGTGTPEHFPGKVTCFLAYWMRRVAKWSQAGVAKTDRTIFFSPPRKPFGLAMDVSWKQRGAVHPLALDHKLAAHAWDAALVVVDQ